MSDLTNKDKYDKIFMECFAVEKSVLNDKFVYQCVPAWDSVGHMGMISALEEAFNITMETDDIINFSSYTKGIETVTKYGVSL